MQGNPAALSAYGGSGTIFGYEKNKEDISGMNNFLFGFWGANYGMAFDWTNGKNGYDRSEWSIVKSEFNSSRSFFLGNRLSAIRISEENGTAFSWSPGFIWRPASFASLGFWSEQFVQYGFYQNRMQNIGLSLRPFGGITTTWNLGVKNYEQLKRPSQAEQNFLLELEAFDWTLGLEFPFRLSFSTTFGSYMNSSVAFVSEDFNSDLNFKKFNMILHSNLNRSALENTGMVRIILGNINEKNSGWSLLGRQVDDLETLQNTFALLEKSSARAIVFDFSHYGGGLSISQEIRRGIYSLRSKGKKVAA